MAKLPESRRTEIVIQEVDDEIMIYDLKIDKMLCLNKTAAIIWNACDGKMAFDELKSRHNYSDEIIYLALDELKSRNLLAEGYDSPFTGINRRQLIRKIGLASMTMLPMVSSMIAPTAARAASGLRANCTGCTAPSQCTSNNCLNNVCSVGTTNSFAPNTRLGAPFSVPSADCTSLASANCCSGQRIWFVTNNCFCG